MTRRFSFVMAMIVALGFGLYAAASVQADDRKPNIIYILLDDAGDGDFGGYGQKKFDTPHGARRAAAGMKITPHA